MPRTEEPWSTLCQMLAACCALPSRNLHTIVRVHWGSEWHAPHSWMASCYAQGLHMLGPLAPLGHNNMPRLQQLCRRRQTRCIRGRSRCPRHVITRTWKHQAVLAFGVMGGGAFCGSSVTLLTSQLQPGALWRPLPCQVLNSVIPRLQSLKRAREVGGVGPVHQGLWGS